jgi:hypothetical protein
MLTNFRIALILGTECHLIRYPFLVSQTKHFMELSLSMWFWPHMAQPWDTFPGLYARPDQHFFVSVSSLLNAEAWFTQFRKFAVSISMTTSTSGRILCHYQTTAGETSWSMQWIFRGARVSYRILKGDILARHIKLQRDKTQNIVLTSWGLLTADDIKE